MTDDKRADVDPETLPPELRSARVRYRWIGDDGETRDLILSDGRLRDAEDAGSPDVLLRGHAVNLAELVGGRINLLTAVMRGDVELEGRASDAALLYTFSRHARGSEAKP